jgi:hypothetical protein
VLIAEASGTASKHTSLPHKVMCYSAMCEAERNEVIVKARDSMLTPSTFIDINGGSQSLAMLI